jgi:hypothetical protein
VLKETGNARQATEAANKEIVALGGSFEGTAKKGDGFAASVASINFQGLS